MMNDVDWTVVVGDDQLLSGDVERHVTGSNLRLSELHQEVQHRHSQTRYEIVSRQNAIKL
jgi:hypothetical protein